MSSPNRRILIVDDNQAIQRDFRKILCPDARDERALERTEARLFETVPARPPAVAFELEFASQGAEALEQVRRALAERRPFAAAFIDVRMPPGWDGIETTAKIWGLDPALQVILCTAYADYSWASIAEQLNHSDRFVILKKPFDTVEVLQLASAFVGKWNLAENQRRTEALLRESQSELEKRVLERTEKLHLQTSALEAADNGIMICDRDGHILWLNSAFTRLTGYSPAEVLGRTPALLKSGQHDRAFYETLWDSILHGHVWRGELVNRHKDGHLYCEEMTITPVHDAEGRIQNFVAIQQDISKRKAMEQALANERDLLQALMDNVPDFIYFKDTESRFTRINRAHAQFLGLRHPAEAIGQTDARFFANRFARQTRVDEQRIFATGELLLDQVEELQTARGRLWVSATKVPIRDCAGRVTGLVGVSRDITERKRVEEELCAQRESFRALTENAPDGIVRLDRNLRFVYVNRRSAQNAGVPASEFLGKTPAELGLPAWPERDAAARRVFETGQTATREFQVETAAGRRSYESRLVPEHSPKGDVLYVLVLTRDVTERKTAEKQRQLMEVQLRQAQKLESIGQLAAGIAHEINTPTQYVGDNTRFLKDAFESLAKAFQVHDELLRAARANAVTPDLVARAEQAAAESDLQYFFEQIPAAIKESLEGIERVTKIVRAMKEFSHPGGKEKSAADLNKAIESTVTVARNEWKYVADLQLDLDPQLPAVPCFLGEFNQAVLNLVINAAHAIGDVVKQQPGAKGKITVSTRRDGECVEVRVSDTGTGIPEAARPHIFEPFFTTKDVGKGTGQGLTMVYGSIVKKHGGGVRFETEVGKGTTFILRLPLSARMADTRTLAREAVPPAEPAAAVPA